MKNIKFNKSINKNWLAKHHFRYNPLLSDSESECYTYRFPVYKWQAITTLEAELKVYLQDKVIKLDVYDGSQTRDIYAPYYYQEYGNYDVIMDKINKSINEKLNKLNLSWIDV